MQFRKTNFTIFRKFLLMNINMLPEKLIIQKYNSGKIQEITIPENYIYIFRKM